MKGACNQRICGVCGWKLAKNGRMSTSNTACCANGVELRGFGGAAHQQGFSEHSPRKPLARANAQPAFATSPRQPSRVRIPKLINWLIPRINLGINHLSYLAAEDDTKWAAGQRWLGWALSLDSKPKRRPDHCSTKTRVSGMRQLLLSNKFSATESGATFTRHSPVA